MHNLCVILRNKLYQVIIVFWYIISDLYPSQWASLLALCLRMRKLRPPVVIWLALGQVAEKWRARIHTSSLWVAMPTHKCLHLPEGSGEGRMRARACEVALVVNNPPANAGDMRPGFDPWVGKIPWRRKWQPTPLFLSGESHGQRSLVG